MVISRLYRLPILRNLKK